jgi:hypothetical protein
MWLKPFSDSLCRMRVRLPVHIPDKSPSDLAVRRLDLAILSGFASANAKIEPMTSRQISV